MGFDGAETKLLSNCTHFRHPTDEQLRQLDIYRSRTSDRGLSSSNCLWLAQSKWFSFSVPDSVSEVFAAASQSTMAQVAIFCNLLNGFIWAWEYHSFWRVQIRTGVKINGVARILKRLFVRKRLLRRLHSFVDWHELVSVSTLLSPHFVPSAAGSILEWQDLPTRHQRLLQMSYKTM